MSPAYAHVLVATDFSPDADRAVQTAAALARACRAKLTLFHAFGPGSFDRISSSKSKADVEAALAQRIRVRLAGIAAQELRDFDDCSCVAERTPNAAHAIAEHARAHDVDLCVVGTHGRSGVRRLVAGSVAERVIRHAPCDVLAVQHEHVPWPPPRILVATDFSEASFHAVEHARQLAEQLSVPLTLVHVYNESMSAPVEDGGFFETIDEGLARTRALLDTAARERLGGSATVDVRTGFSTARGIAALAEEHAAGLVIVGRHGHTSFGHMLVGSVAEQVVRHAPCSILVASPEVPGEGETT